MDADMRPQEAALPHLVSAHGWKILTATTTPAVVRHLPRRDRSAELALSQQRRGLYVSAISFSQSPPCGSRQGPGHRGIGFVPGGLQ